MGECTNGYGLLHLIYHVILPQKFYSLNWLICQWFDIVISVVKIDCEVQVAHNKATYTLSSCSIKFVDEFVEHTLNQMRTPGINNHANAQGMRALGMNLSYNNFWNC